jgi:hypothetical protein
VRRFKAHVGLAGDHVPRPLRRVDPPPDGGVRRTSPEEPTVARLTRRYGTRAMAALTNRGPTSCSKYSS